MIKLLFEAIANFRRQLHRSSQLTFLFHYWLYFLFSVASWMQITDLFENHKELLSGVEWPVLSVIIPSFCALQPTFDGAVIIATVSHYRWVWRIIFRRNCSDAETRWSSGCAAELMGRHLNQYSYKSSLLLIGRGDKLTKNMRIIKGWMIFYGSEFKLRSSSIFFAIFCYFFAHSFKSI